MAQTTITVAANQCNKCGYTWVPHKKTPYKVCPKCLSHNWNKPPSSCSQCGYTWIPRAINPACCPRCRTILWNRDRKEYSGKPGIFQLYDGQIASMRRDGKTLQEIGDTVGVSRERVRQVIEKHYPEANDPHRKHEATWLTFQCHECGKSFTLRESDVHARNKNRKCDFHFCSKQCAGKYHGKAYGFAVHPENIRLGIIASSVARKRTHDYDMVWAKHQETGYGAWRLAELLNIPVSTISLILRTKRATQPQPTIS